MTLMMRLTFGILISTFPYRVSGVQTVVVCSNDTLTITCPDNHILQILEGRWGRTAVGLSPCYHKWLQDGKIYNCYEDILTTLHGMCEEKESCVLQKLSSFTDPCPNVLKYLNVTYTCNTIDTTPWQTTTEMTSQGCICPCEKGENKWDYLKNTNYTLDELRIILKPELDRLKQAIQVDKKRTNKSMRLKSSAPDVRTSAVSIGYLGICIITFICVLPVAADVFKMYRKKKKMKLKREILFEKNNEC